MGWEKGFFEVDLSQVKTPDLDPNWERTQHGVTRQQIDGWNRQLGEIQRMSVERGYTYDDFQRMRHNPVPAEKELGETHHKFYDNREHGSNKDHVDLIWENNEYRVDVNGNHRVYSAKEMGIRRMPAQVSAPSEHMAQRKQEGYSSNLMHPDDRADFARNQPQSPQLPSRASSPTSPSAPNRTDPGGASGTPSGRVSR